MIRHFAPENQRISTQPIGLVMIGDSITENWALFDPELFSRQAVNRGIQGQVTAQILLRFRQDVLQLRPQAVHILAGTNDIAQNFGAVTPEEFQDNIMTMVELAKAHRIRVLLASILPAADFPWRSGLAPTIPILALNQWLRAYAESAAVTYVDYHAALSAVDGSMRSDVAIDGVHPNREGYRLMRGVLERTSPELCSRLDTVMPAE